ncbi:Bifunctional glmu protein [Globisporangium polare]
MTGGGNNDALASATLLLSCAAVSLVTSMAVHLYFQVAAQQHEHQSAAATGATSYERSKAHGQATSDSIPPEKASPSLPPIALQGLLVDEVPEVLRLDAYVSPGNQQRFAHAALFNGCTNVFAVLNAIHPYAVRFFVESMWVLSSADDGNVNATILKASTNRDRDSQWRLPECIDPEDSVEILLYPGVDPLTFAPDKIINLPASTNTTGVSTKAPQKKHIVIQPGALILGGTFDVSDGSIFVGRKVRVEPNVFIKGPTIIGDGSTLRSGTYIRGDVIVGRDVVLRGELKNALVLDQAELCHPGYCGDSICGFKSHFGNQVTTANLNLFSSGNLTIDVDGQRYDTGRKKIGVVLGDHSQLGCSVVTDPCTLLLKNTVAYPLSRLRKDIYGPNEIIKNKPMEHGVLEIAPLRPAI